LAYQATAPFLKFFQAVDNKIINITHFLFTIKELNRENINLKNENQSLWQENSQLKEIALKNEFLRQRLQIPLPENKKLILADIIGYSPQFGQYFLIDKGARDGLKSGLAAVTANDFLVGQVVEVNDHYAKVILLLDSASSINALTQETRTNGLAKGNLGLSLNMEMIPVSTQIKTGETVLSSGLNDDIPKELIIGQITEIIKKESEIFQKAVIKPAADFAKLESIFIVLE
jgi:rod shape-determining protein MreC